MIAVENITCKLTTGILQDVVDKSGTIVGKAQRWYEPEEQEPEKTDLSLLAGNRVNKSGYIVDNSGKLLGRVVEGDPAKLVGKMCDKEGQIWNEGGSVVGRAELLPESEREGQKEGPFSDFQPATVRKDGKVIDNSGTVIGRLVEVRNCLQMCSFPNYTD